MVDVSTDAAEERRDTGASSLRISFLGFAREGSRELRASFKLTLSGSPFRAHVVLGHGGTAYELHVAHAARFDGDTTGDRELDQLLVERAQEELVRARASAVVRELDREVGGRR